MCEGGSHLPRPHPPGNTKQCDANIKVCDPGNINSCNVHEENPKPHFRPGDVKSCGSCQETLRRDSRLGHPPASPEIGPKQQESTGLQLEAENFKSAKKPRLHPSPPRRPEITRPLAAVASRAANLRAASGLRAGGANAAASLRACGGNAAASSLTIRRRPSPPFPPSRAPRLQRCLSGAPLRRLRSFGRKAAATSGRSTAEISGSGPPAGPAPRAERRLGTCAPRGASRRSGGRGARGGWEDQPPPRASPRRGGRENRPARPPSRSPRGHWQRGASWRGGTDTSPARGHTARTAGGALPRSRRMAPCPWTAGLALPLPPQPRPAIRPQHLGPTCLRASAARAPKVVAACGARGRGAPLHERSGARRWRQLRGSGGGGMRRNRPL